MHIGGQGDGEGLSGNLEWLGELRALEEVLLWENSFEGPFPETMRHLAKLARIEVGNNPLNCEIPEWFVELGARFENFMGRTGIPWVFGPACCIII